jgi:hypothetical protein
MRLLPHEKWADRRVGFPLKKRRGARSIPGRRKGVGVKVQAKPGHVKPAAPTVASRKHHFRPARPLIALVHRSCSRVWKRIYVVAVAAMEKVDVPPEGPVRRVPETPA